MNILIATSEATPFAKTGGLADVCGALPRELSRLGHNVSVIMPAFRQVYQAGCRIEDTGIRIDVPIGSKIVGGDLQRSYLPDSDVPIYFVRQDDYYDRPELYRVDGKDYKDNCERFVFFCRAVMESIRLSKLPVDILHCNDWQTGLIPAYQRIEYAAARGFEQIATLLTIHNMSYQGQFWHWDMLLTGLDWKYFNWHQMEFYGNLNLLKTGIVFADALSTVSATYAREIQTAPLGCGLEGVLQQRSKQLFGIINGVDYGVWNPAHDAALARPYDVEDWKEGKAACKQALQRAVGLPEAVGTPVIGLVGRLASQKGWDLVSQLMKTWVQQDEAQWVILGTGEPEYHEVLSNLAQNCPQKVAVKLQFSDPLAHQIEAGSDIFLMPSKFEPCGLNQLYSLKYGTVPVVRATGGLADTITDATPENVTAGTATGFCIRSYDLPALNEALTRACQTYRNQADTWDKIVSTGMQQDWSWANSARSYGRLYQQLVSQKRQVAFA